MISPRRPALRWHGGKWMLAPWIISHFPAHRVYTETFGGAASVLMRKPRAHAEIYNDLDGDVVNLFRVLRSDRAEQLIAALRLTPFAREEFQSAYHQIDNEVERARALVIRSFMGFGSNSHHRKSGFRANSNRSGSIPAHDWVNYPDNLVHLIHRLRGVVIENKDATAIMTQHDAETTLHFVDPPYVMSTRSDAASDYAYELSDDDHASLLTFLCGLCGMVVLCGYPNAQYDQTLSGWLRVERNAFADGPTGLRSAPSDQFGQTAVAGYEAIGAKPCVIIVECEA